MGTMLDTKISFGLVWMGEKSKCSHSVRLGDNETYLMVDKKIYLGIALYQHDGAMVRVKRLPFYIIPSLENKVIIGLKALVGPLLIFS